MKQTTLSLIFLLSSVVVFSTATTESKLESLLDDIEAGVTILTQPLAITLFSLYSLVCPAIKSIGFTLASLTGLIGAEEPDLETLAILYTTPKGSVFYNISSAATEIVSNPYFDASQKVYIFIHGFTGQANSSVYREFSANLLGIGEHNVLALDASELLKWWYIRATTYIDFIADKLAEVIIAMVNKGVDPANVHLVGHSLGAHIAGFTGKNLTLGRITGLDPAGPCFAYLKSKYRLNSTDATFVDVIHSNAGVLGIPEDVGHVDYWPNGGSLQPGCNLVPCTSEACILCNHYGAVYYFLESINSNYAFPARQCSSYLKYTQGLCDNNDLSYMGYISNNKASGKYYLATNSESPYGKGSH